MPQSKSFSNQNRSPKKYWDFLIGMSIGHALKHFYQQGILILLPHIKTTFGLTDIEIGFIGTSRAISSGVVNFPAAIITDLFRNRISIVLTVSLLCMALGYFFMGISNAYWIIILAAIITGGGASLWHAPAYGTLAAVYPHQRAFALSFHRAGGTLGDTLSPIILGGLIGGFIVMRFLWGGIGWQYLSLLLAIPAVVGAALIYAYSRTRSTHKEFSGPTEYIHSVKSLLRNKDFIGILAINGVQSLIFNALTIFMVIYMKEDLRFSDLTVGYHLALMSIASMIGSPLIGKATDLVGRRPMIFVSVLSYGILIFCLMFFGTGTLFTMLLPLLGIFMLSINPLLLAAAIDCSRKGIEGSGVAVMFSTGALFGGISPIIAGVLRQNHGMDGVFYYCGILAFIVALFTLFIPMHKSTNNSSNI